MQKVGYRGALGAKQIVQDILLDMETEPRLVNGRGNAMLVGDSIYQACKFYEMFVNAGFKDRSCHRHEYVCQTLVIFPRRISGRGATEKLRQYEIISADAVRLFRYIRRRSCRTD